MAASGAVLSRLGGAAPPIQLSPLGRFRGVEPKTAMANQGCGSF